MAQSSEQPMPSVRRRSYDSRPSFQIETAMSCDVPPSTALTSVCVSSACDCREEDRQCPRAIWLPELAPSPELVRWRESSVGNWDEFARRYRLELSTHEPACERLRQTAGRDGLLLLYHEGACDQNVAVVLKRHLERLECQRRWDEGLMIGGYLYPIRETVIRCGGLWFERHRAWMLPDRDSWKFIQSLLPGDF